MGIVMIFQGDDPSASFKGPTQALTLLARAAYQNDLDYVKVHVPNNSTLDPEAIYFALSFATLGGQMQVLKYLLDIYPCAKWQTVSTAYEMDGMEFKATYPGSLAGDMAQYDNGQIVETYLAHGLDPNWQIYSVHCEEPDSLVYYCASNPESLKVLIDHGADARGRSLSGKFNTDCLRTPMCAAAETNSVKCLELLLTAGAEFGHALWCAARDEALDSIKFIVQNGFNINEHFSFRSADLPEYVLRLPDFKYPIDAGTALHASIILFRISLEDSEGGHLETAKYLVSLGASLEECDHLGKTPYDYALDCEFCSWSNEDIEFFKPRSL